MRRSSAVMLAFVVCVCLVARAADTLSGTWNGTAHSPQEAVTFTLTKRVFQHVIEGGTTFAGAVAAGDATAVGDVAAAGTIFDHLDVFMNFFKLVEP